MTAQVDGEALLVVCRKRCDLPIDSLYTPPSQTKA